MKKNYIGLGLMVAGALAFFGGKWLTGRSEDQANNKEPGTPEGAKAAQQEFTLAQSLFEKIALDMPTRSLKENIALANPAAFTIISAAVPYQGEPVTPAQVLNAYELEKSKTPVNTPVGFIGYVPGSIIASLPSAAVPPPTPVVTPSLSPAAAAAASAAQIASQTTVAYGQNLLKLLGM